MANQMAFEKCNFTEDKPKNSDFGSLLKGKLNSGKSISPKNKKPVTQKLPSKNYDSEYQNI